jgi:APA family basic amino acid/polyamine antiporter
MEKKVFARESTGLVRQIAPHQAFIYNFMAIGLYGFTWATLFSNGYAVFPGANLGLSILTLALAAVPFYLATAMLSSAMPRAGGDYVWQSRVIHPSVGFASTFSAWTVWQWYFASFLGLVITTLGIAPFFALLGQTNPSYAKLASAMTANFGFNTLNFEITTVIVLLGFLIAALGMRFYVRLQYVLFAGSAISAFTLLGVLASTSHARFVSSFNNFVAPFIPAQNQSAVASAGGYYQWVVKTAEASGITTTPGFSLANTVSAWGIIWISLGYAFWNIYNLGEMKRAGELKNQVWTQVGSNLVFAAFLIALWYLLEKVIGIQFLYSYYGLWTQFSSAANPAQALFTPYYPAIISAITNSPWIWAIILVGLTFGIFQVVLIVFFASTRIMLAASLDRVLPNWVGKVNDRTHAPLYALIISAIGCEAFLYLIIYETSFLSYFSTAGLATQIAYIFISITAILLPYRMKQIYEASPASKYKLGGIPVLSLSGMIALIVNLWIAYVFVAGPALGTLSVPLTSSIEFVLAIFFLCLIIYLIAYAIRRSQALDLSLAFKEIPPE